MSFHQHPGRKQTLDVDTSAAASVQVERASDVGVRAWYDVHHRVGSCGCDLRRTGG